MRAALLVVSITLMAALLSACGAAFGLPSSSPVSGAPRGSPRGEQIFDSAGCAGCHTLAAAEASGSVGPDLDSLKPSYQTVVRQVEEGGGEMPSFAQSLSPAAIAAVAHFVYTATH